MYEKRNPDELELKNFYQPFGGKMNPENRWIKMAEMIPWEKLEEKYASQFKAIGRGAKKVRMALGALLIQQKFGFSDEETVTQIIENPYYQYFIGLSEYQGKKPFDSSMMVYFRKRVKPEMLEEVNNALCIKKKTEKAKDKKKDDDPPPENRGKLLLDATCTPADIKFPTDLNLLNESREKLEVMIDESFSRGELGGKRPRTYRRVARKNYLTAAKNKKISEGKLKAAIRKQLQYVKRDLGYLERADPTKLTKKQGKDLAVIRKLYEQQKEMFEKQIHSIPDRIVSISQDHVRPIIRGKAGAGVEFGAKVSISVLNGFAFADKISWDNYNEGTILKEHVQKYLERFGCYPKAVIVDKIYRTRENQAFCKAHGIRLSGPALGRPKMDEREREKIKVQEKKDISVRNAVEGSFGNGKRKYGLNLIMAKLPDTSETVIRLNFVLMNIERKLRFLLRLFFVPVFYRYSELKSCA